MGLPPVHRTGGGKKGVGGEGGGGGRLREGETGEVISYFAGNMGYWVPFIILSDAEIAWTRITVCFFFGDKV